MHGIIYLATNIQNHKVYVGQTIYSLNHRKNKHEYNSKFDGDIGRFAAAIRKYGKQNFRWIILGECESRIELDESEQYCIEFFPSTNKLYGYNMASGSTSSAGYTHSYDSIQKMSNVLKQRGNLKGSKNAMFGKTMIQRLVDKHGEVEGTKRYWQWREKQSANNKGTNNPNYKHGKNTKVIK